MVIVIGGSGFIGSYLVEELLNEGYEVLVTGRNKGIQKHYEEIGIKFLEFDLTKEEDYKKLPTENVDGVILLAGMLPANVEEENVEDYFKVNVLGTIKVLEYCRKNNIKKLISTTSYADVRKSWDAEVALKEEEPRNFLYTGDHAIYVISKNAASDVMEYYNETYGMQCAAFRLPPVYGVGPHSTIYVNGKLYKTGIQTFIDNAKAGNPIEIWGDPEIKRDIVYVKDVAKAFVLALKSDKTKGLYNMTSGTQVTLKEQVETVIKLFSKEDNKSEIIYRKDKKNNTPSFIFDISKAKRDFGYEPKYLPFEKMMIDYKEELEKGRFDFLVESRIK